MVYHYDRKADEDPEWLERLGNAADVRKSAQDLVSVLEKDPDGELGDLITAAQAIANNIDDSVETESDFNANTNEALKAVAKLKELLKAAKPMLRKNDLPDSVEIVDEALSDLRGLTKELSELQPES
jgi:predicted phage tail protein